MCIQINTVLVIAASFAAAIGLLSYFKGRYDQRLDQEHK